MRGWSKPHAHINVTLSKCMFPPGELINISLFFLIINLSDLKLSKHLIIMYLNLQFYVIIFYISVYFEIIFAIPVLLYHGDGVELILSSKT